MYDLTDIRDINSHPYGHCCKKNTNNASHGKKLPENFIPSVSAVLHQHLDHVETIFDKLCFSCLDCQHPDNNSLIQESLEYISYLLDLLLLS